MVFRCLEM
uniref:Uncharacterized protein n=1 Tax=Rhizophora mucronata TaxID=61149 RepID=A0A2P2QEF1_RHIMU